MTWVIGSEYPIVTYFTESTKNASKEELSVIFELSSPLFLSIVLNIRQLRTLHFTHFIVAVWLQLLFFLVVLWTDY